MAYYHTPSSTERSPGRLEAKLSDGAMLGPPDGGWTPTLAALCGFVEIVQTARPADTATDTSDRSLTFSGGVPTVTWTVRAKNAGELAAATATATAGTLDSQVRAAYAANRNYLAIASPTNAQIAAQVRLLTRENQALIRLLLARDLLDATID